VDRLYLAWFKTIEAETQGVALDQRCFEQLVSTGADMLSDIFDEIHNRGLYKKRCPACKAGHVVAALLAMNGRPWPFVRRVK
jgi:hypothetical protein